MLSNILAAAGSDGTLMLAVIIAESVLIVALLITVIVLAAKNKKYRTANKTKSENVKIIDGVRYTTDKAELTASGEAAITHLVGDFILERGITYTTRKSSRLIPGKYTILSGIEGVEKFNVRIGGFVREVKHASDIVLSEGDEICAVSHPAILR